MRIAIITELFYPHVGGQENRYHELSSHLCRHGNQVHVFALKHDEHLPCEERINGVHVHRYSYVKDYVRSGSRSVKGVIQFSLQSVQEVLARASFDVYLFNQWPLLHVLCLKPFCRSLSVIDWCELWGGFVGLFQRTISKLCDVHVTVSSSIKKQLIDSFWVDESTIEVIPSGINSRLYRPSFEQKIVGDVLFVGRLVPHKQIGMLVNGVRMAHKIHPDIRLDVVGSGPLLSSLKRDLVSVDFVRVHGWVSDSEKVELLKKAWVLVLPSMREGFPRVVAEAMASGTPVVTTDYLSNGACDVVREYRSGFVVPPSASDISDCLVRLFENNVLWASFAKNCTEAAQFLDWDVLVNRFETFLKSRL